jgi:DNA repair protein RecO (recombination protein O)
MSNLVRSKLIVLRKTKYSEADLIIQGLIPEGRRISLIARGGLRSKKRFGGGVLEPTHHIEVQYKEGTNEFALATLQEATLLHDFSGIRSSYDRLELALQILDWVSSSSQEGEVHASPIYDLIGHTLTAIEKARDLSSLRAHFIVRFLLQHGMLEQESWMAPYLATPMSDFEKIQTPVEPRYLTWLEDKLADYLGKSRQY